MQRGVKSILICAPTGSGKTLLTAHMLQSAAKKGMSSFFIVHRRELVKQSAEAFSGEGVRYGIISNGFLPNPKPLVQIASIQTLANRVHLYKKPALVVWDECFDGNTLVDGKKISSLCVGDFVSSYNEATGFIEKQKISHIFKNKAPKEIYRVRFSYGNSVVCTSNHPFYSVHRGWTKCEQLKVGEKIYAMPRLRGAFKERFSKKVLTLLSSFNGSKKYSNRAFKDEAKQPHVDARNQGESFSKIKTNWSQTKNSRRQRETIAFCSANSIKGFEHAYRSEGSNRCKIFLSNKLQGGYSRRKIKDSNRSGWGFASVNRASGARPKKGGFFDISRVESIEIHKQTSNGKFGGLCKDGFVYNLEVENNNNYFANGLLVHNCHHTAAKSWAKVRAAYPDAFHVGLTATPERLDGAGLRKYFSEIVHGPSVEWLIQNKYLSNYKLYAPATINTEGIHTRMGDYVQSELSAVIDKPSITGDVISHYQKYANGKRAIVFCVSVEHSKHVVSQFLGAGISASHVDGDTDSFERDKAIHRFKNGDCKILSNVDLFGEGFNVPNMEAAILLRPTQSLGLYLQQVGRSLRPSEGKTQAIILDHAGNCRRHGLPDDPREWSLDGRDAKKKNNDSERIKICPKCFAAAFPGRRECPHCKHVFELKPREVEQKDGDLKEIDLNAERRRRFAQQGKAQSMDELIALGKQRGYVRPYAWAAHIFRARQAKKLQGAA